MFNYLFGILGIILDNVTCKHVPSVGWSGFSKPKLTLSQPRSKKVLSNAINASPNHLLSDVGLTLGANPLDYSTAQLDHP